MIAPEDFLDDEADKNNPPRAELLLSFLTADGDTIFVAKIAQWVSLDVLVKLHNELEACPGRYIDAGIVKIGGSEDEWGFVVRMAYPPKGMKPVTRLSELPTTTPRYSPPSPLASPGM